MNPALRSCLEWAFSIILAGAIALGVAIVYHMASVPRVWELW